MLFSSDSCQYSIHAVFQSVQEKGIRAFRNTFSPTKIMFFALAVCAVFLFCLLCKVKP